MKRYSLLIASFLILSVCTYAQKSLTQISFYELESNDESAARLDTVSEIGQVIPLISGPEGAAVNNRDRHYIFQDTVGRDVIRVEYRTAKSDFSKRKVDYEQQRIDGAVAFGHDGFDDDKLTYIMQDYIEEIKITINGKSVPLTPKLYRNFFSCGIVKILKALDKDLLFLHFSGGDGAGHYNVVWSVNSQGLVASYVNNGDIFFESIVKNSSRKKYYDILLNDDSWSYFPNHEVRKFRPTEFLTQDKTALDLAKSLDLSILLESDPTYGEYGMIKSPRRDTPIEFFISAAMKTKDNQFEYEVSGLMKDGQHIVALNGRQLIRQAKVEDGVRGALIVHGTFRFTATGQGYHKNLSGLWTLHIKEVNTTATVLQTDVNHASVDNTFKSFSGTMTSNTGKALELAKFGNATVAGNWFGTPSGMKWWRR